MQDTASEVIVPSGEVRLPGTLTVPPNPAGIVIFAHGSGSGRHSPRNLAVAGRLVDRGCGTLLLDLLTPAEAADRRNTFDIALLSARVRAAAAWLRTRPDLGRLPVGYFGASTGAAAALVAAAEPGSAVAAVVSRGGRPDLAADSLPRVAAPTLLLVGSLDTEVLRLNRQAQARMRAPAVLRVIEGAGHLFEEPGTLERVAEEAAAWFAEKFAARATARGS